MLRPLKGTTRATRIDCYGFLSPDGRWYRCRYMGHSRLAHRLTEQLYRERVQAQTQRNGWCDRERLLTSLGWVVLHDENVSYDRAPTSAQCDFLWRLVQRLGNEHRQARAVRWVLRTATGE